jgi:hypothetical protein
VSVPVSVSGGFETWVRVRSFGDVCLPNIDMGNGEKLPVSEVLKLE